MKIGVCLGEQLARYHFGPAHPFGPQRYSAFMEEFERRGLRDRVTTIAPVAATEEDLALFHTRDYIHQVKALSAAGTGYLDAGDTPAVKGIYDAGLWVTGGTLVLLDKVCSGEIERGFIPIAGLHHARRDRAAGFCVFNDCGVAIEALRRRHGLQRIAYVDIDAHHGDGVFYSFETDPGIIIVDFHEDGRYLYPGSGSAAESGIGQARGTKLNIPMQPGADNDAFCARWDEAEEFLRAQRPEIILLQCGADSLAGDPITHLEYSPETHRHAARRLGSVADECCGGRIVAMGGGGYKLENLALAWCAVIEGLLDPSFASEKRTMKSERDNVGKRCPGELIHGHGIDDDQK